MFCLDFALSFACFGYATSESKKRGYDLWRAIGRRRSLVRGPPARLG